METVMRQQLEGTRLTPEQMQLAMNRATSPGQVYATYGGTVIVGMLSVLLIAGLLTVFALMGSKQPNFGSNFSAVALALFPYRLVICAMTLLVLIASPDRTTRDERRRVYEQGDDVEESLHAPERLRCSVVRRDRVDELRVLQSEPNRLGLRVVFGAQPVADLRLHSSGCKRSVLRL
jgi:hypothetical protein